MWQRILRVRTWVVCIRMTAYCSQHCRLVRERGNKIDCYQKKENRNMHFSQLRSAPQMMICYCDACATAVEHTENGIFGHIYMHISYMIVTRLRLRIPLCDASTRATCEQHRVRCEYVTVTIWLCHCTEACILSKYGHIYSASIGITCTPSPSSSSSLCAHRTTVGIIILYCFVKNDGKI